MIARKRIPTVLSSDSLAEFSTLLDNPCEDGFKAFDRRWLEPSKRRIGDCLLLSAFGCRRRLTNDSIESAGVVACHVFEF